MSRRILIYQDDDGRMTPYLITGLPDDREPRVGDAFTWFRGKTTELVPYPTTDPPEAS